MINKIVLVKIRKTTWPVTVNRSNMILKFNIDSSRPDGLSIIVRLILQKGKSSLKFFKFFIPFCHIFAFCQGRFLLRVFVFPKSCWSALYFQGLWVSRTFKSNLATTVAVVHPLQGRFYIITQQFQICILPNRFL